MATTTIKKVRPVIKKASGNKSLSKKIASAKKKNDLTRALIKASFQS